jgi:flagellar basal-body rod protein FlgF
METPSYIVLSRQLGLQRQMDVVANNLANSSTAGFKAEGMVFSEYLIEAGPDNELSYVQDLASYRDFSAGPIQPTGNDLDVAIQGTGYFIVQTPEGQRYTRAGRFQLDRAGQLVNSAGFPILSGGAPILINPDDGPVTVAEDGTISAHRTQGGSAPVIYGKIDVVDFADEKTLEPIGGALFAAATPPRPAEGFTIQQRMLEGSNVQSILEMTNMISVQRNYQAIQNFLDGEHDRMRRAVNYIIPSA